LLKAAEARRQLLWSVKMNVFEKTAFAWIVCWVFIDSFAPDVAYQEKIKTCAVITASIAYLYGLHVVVWERVRRVMRKEGSS